MTETATRRIHRFVAAPKPEVGDPHAATVQRLASDQGFANTAVRTAKVYLIDADLDDEAAHKLRSGLLIDAVAETTDDRPALPVVIEVHPLPGVMDPVARSVEEAAHTLLSTAVRASTGVRYEFDGIDHEQALTLVSRWLANPVVHRIHEGEFHPDALPEGTPSEFKLTHIPIRELTAAQLNTLSRDAHLFLDEAEMLAIQTEYRTLDRDPTDIELETLAQTWSEHCVHKTLKSNIRYTPNQSRGHEHAATSPADPIDWTNRPGHEINPDGSITIHNLLKSTVAAATHELIAEGIDWTLSVFVDNAGIVALDDDHAVCVKVETHNHPSAIEPYGGAATGIGGCIRDIIGTGLAAKPIANTNVFCVAHPDGWHGSPSRDSDTNPLPEGCLHPKHTLQEVAAGVRDYGNRMGIPTLNGAVWFDDRYVGNPLVFAGSIGIMPNHLIAGDANPGDLIVALGGRTGRDGIHGATFSSAELTDTHADEFSHAVQIGNAIEEKRVLDAILRARDEQAEPLFTSITDCGAGGFSSAVGEMGEKVGAEVNLDQAPLKYAGLTYTEIWISEAQERMVLAVPRENIKALQQICDEEHVELAILGEFGRTGNHGPELILNYQSTEVGRMPMPFLHDGIPTPTREASWTPSVTAATPAITNSAPAIDEALLKLLSHPNIASKHSIIRAYDHEVQGRTILKPLVGPGGRGPGDAAVIEPKPGTGIGLAIGCGLATGLEDDPYLMALAAIDECVRNLVCVGADPARIAILDNFCWPSCKKPENLGSLVRAAEGCYDAAKAYKTPFVSGKDSLNNQFTTKDGTTIEIPPTLLITGIGRVSDVNKCVTMDTKSAGNVLLHVGPPPKSLAGSHFARTHSDADDKQSESPDRVDLNKGPATAHAIAKLINAGLIRSAHDISDGGALAAIAEMLIASSSPHQAIGAEIDLTKIATNTNVAAFAESPSRYIIEVAPDNVNAVRDALSGIHHEPIGETTDTTELRVNNISVPVDDLTKAWLNPLDW